MYEHLSERCLDQWLSNFDDFRVALLRQSQTLCKVVGCYFEFDQKALKAAHDAWVADVAMWQSSMVSANSNGLSHLKLMGILVCKLAQVGWVTNLYPFNPADDGYENSFAGSAALRADTLQDINAGRGTYLAFQFAIQVLNWFEAARDDKIEPFSFRLTVDLQHDMMVYLTNRTVDDVAFFIMLKALYARQP